MESNQKNKFSLFTDILKEKGKWSQGRVYLFISILAYYFMLSLLTYRGIYKDTNMDISSFKEVIEGLQWAMGTFSLYVFGGKSVDTISSIMNKTGTNNSTTPKSNPVTEKSNKKETEEEKVPFELG